MAGLRGYIPADTWRLYNSAFTSMQRQDIVSTLMRRCINVIYPLGFDLHRVRGHNLCTNSASLDCKSSQCLLVLQIDSTVPKLLHFKSRIRFWANCACGSVHSLLAHAYKAGLITPRSISINFYDLLFALLKMGYSICNRENQQQKLNLCEFLCSNYFNTY